MPDSKTYITASKFKKKMQLESQNIDCNETRALFQRSTDLRYVAHKLNIISHFSMNNPNKWLEFIFCTNNNNHVYYI